MGGKNPFLGIAYVVVGGICIVLGALFTALHLIKPRYVASTCPPTAPPHLIVINMPCGIKNVDLDPNNRRPIGSSATTRT